MSGPLRVYLHNCRNAVEWALLASLVGGTLSVAQSRMPGDLGSLSLEDLMNIQVTSVSKKEQKLSRAGAAVYVITAEDIRRSGATNIPDLLRMVPGVTVARINGSGWAISIRGFADRFANKVLVLIDGRAVYDTTFSGVLWDQQTVPVENIERIEVIRGPGGTVWGANAVNGVINVITFSALDTQGGLLAAGGGSEPRVQALARYGGKIGRNSAYRVYGGHFGIGSTPQPGGGNYDDGWRDFQSGFRTDWELSPQDHLTVQGDVQGLKKTSLSPPYSPKGCPMRRPSRTGAEELRATCWGAGTVFMRAARKLHCRHITITWIRYSKERSMSGTRAI